MEAPRPRIVIAGTHSGCGKTTVASGIMAVLSKRGIDVRPYKIGPDYIDPMFHRLATGNPSINLDTWICSKSDVRKIFSSNAKDVNVIEGVMGLYDGLDATNEIGSTSHLAKLLGTPVILVVDASAMARSVSALVKGYTSFDPKLNVAGVIFNFVGGDGHFELLKKSTRGTKVLGCLPNDPLLKLPERHLGLVPTNELVDLGSWINRLADRVEQYIDLKQILKIAESVEPMRSAPGKTENKANIKIAIARDSAFNFYYESNLQLLRDLGAELVEFSPLHDSAVPGDAGAIIFGGGFPEAFAEKLSLNHSMKKSLINLAWSGIPIYAECGGLMYLAKEIVDSSGRIFPMTSLIPGQMKMEKTLQNFGYCYAEALHDTCILRKGERFRGHEFHYSEWKGSSTNAVFKVGKKNLDRLEGYGKDNIHASYIHLNWTSAKQIPNRLVQAAEKYLLNKGEQMQKEVMSKTK